MYARWGSFAIGLGLIFAPLAVGYQDVGSTLHDIAIGLTACIVALAALENPALRFLNALPAAWLAWSGRLSADPWAGPAEMLGGVLLLATALAPRARLAAERGRAGMRA